MTREPQAISIEESREQDLEKIIGREVRGFRKQLELTLLDLSRVTGLSSAMLSKIENGQASPSLTTLKVLAKAFAVPVSVFFRELEERHDASFVAHGEGVEFSRKGRRMNHQAWLLGHCASRRVSVEPYLVRLTAKGEMFPRVQDSGVWFIHVLEGRMLFRYGDSLYELGPGDSLTYESSVPHGTDKVLQAPVSFLCVHSDRRD